MKLIKKIKKKTRRFKSWFFKRKYSKISFIDSKKLILFFVPDDVDGVNGGMLSICTIIKEVSQIKDIHQANVVASFLPPIKGLDCKYSKFDNDVVIFNFKEISKKFNNLNFLEIHIPEYMIPLFNRDNNHFRGFFDWIKEIEVFKINILNQNDLIMPDIKFIENLKSITPNVSMTVAHEKYATLERRNHYGIALHLLSPWLSPTPYIEKKYYEKDNVIVLSPDDIDRVPSETKITKEQVIEKIKEKLPNYKIKVIQDMSYEDYKKTISNSKFTITFGEGLDGYFVESIFSGGISFAVYNELFFKPNFKSLPSVYSSFDDLYENIIHDINKYDNETSYSEYNNELNKIVTSIYSYDRLKSNVKEYYLGNLDFK